jgi:Ca-activated chloride channel family protein
MRFALLILLLLLLPLSASPSQLTEKVDIDVVNVYLSAVDARDQFVKDLKPQDLILKEDGVSQTITNFASFANEGSLKLGESGVPLTIAFVMDVSSSMGAQIYDTRKIDIVKNAAFRLAEELRPEDQMMLVVFNDNPAELSPLTHDTKKFNQELLFVEVKEGNTALLDSIYFAMERLKGAWGRKLLIVCSDGEDTASYLRFDEVLSNLIASDVTVLAFGTMGLGSNSMRGRYILEKLAQASGGYAFFPSSLHQIGGMIDKLREGMRNQYSIGYRSISLKMDGSWRKIEIVCRRPKIKLRYREGYFAR